jgi:hypothetical protein
MSNVLFLTILAVSFVAALGGAIMIGSTGRDTDIWVVGAIGILAGGFGFGFTYANAEKKS